MRRLERFENGSVAAAAGWVEDREIDFADGGELRFDLAGNETCVRDARALGRVRGARRRCFVFFDADDRRDLRRERERDAAGAGVAVDDLVR